VSSIELIPDPVFLQEKGKGEEERKKGAWL